MLESILLKPFTDDELAKANVSDKSFTWPIPGSKSITNRALVIAALTSGTTKLEGVLHSDDTRHMINALRTFGTEISELGSTSLIVKGGRENFKRPDGVEHEAFIGNSGTTVRFLTTLCCLVPGDVVLRGDEHMAKRPIGDLNDGLKQMDVEIDCPTGCPPLKISSNKFPGGKISMNGSKSSQYFTSIMLSAPYADKDTTIVVENTLVSVPYVTMTAEMMRSFGAEVELIQPKEDEISEIRIKSKPYKPQFDGNGVFSYQIEADASAASYAFAAGAVTGVKVEVKTGIKSASGKSLQGDFSFVEVLSRMGAIVNTNEGVVSVKGNGTLNGVKEDMFHISDTVMTLAAIAPLAKGSSEITNVANIRIKETDRLIATVNELKRLGQGVEFGEDWLKVVPKEVVPAEVECYSDHRMAMSFAILGLLKEGITIKDKKCVSKTYPTFWEHLEMFQNYVRSL